jgi:hypothetical protein
MDRATDQSPRQRGYGSTSSLRNNSLKHTRKHERRRKELNQRTKHSGSGGPSGQEGRTVRTGHADRPACCRGLSAPTSRTVRPCAADYLKKQTEPPETTPNNRPSAGSTRTVRQAAADCRRRCCGPFETFPNENSKPRRIEDKGEEEHEALAKNTDVAHCPPPARGLSAPCGQS